MEKKYEVEFEKVYQKMNETLCAIRSIMRHRSEFEKSGQTNEMLEKLIKLHTIEDMLCYLQREVEDLYHTSSSSELAKELEELLK